MYTMCPHCKETFFTSELEEESFEYEVGEYDGRTYYEKGIKTYCPYCHEELDEDNLYSLETIFETRFDALYDDGLIEDDMSKDEVINVIENDEIMSACDMVFGRDYILDKNNKYKMWQIRERH